jgi:hypothetical protein
MSTASSEHDEESAITRELLACYRTLSEQQHTLRAQQHDCEIDLQHAKFLTHEQKDATLTRYTDVTHALHEVTRKLNALEKDALLYEALAREERAKDARTREATAGAYDRGQDRE